AGLTAFYMFRILILAFMGTHPDQARFEHLRESPRTMTIPLVIFATLSIFFFYSPNPLDASGGWLTHAIQRPESVVPAAVQAASAEMFEEADRLAHTTAMELSLGVAGLGILLAFVTYRWKMINA